MGVVRALRCRECGREHPPTRLYICPTCFGPLDVVYDDDSTKVGRSEIGGRPQTLWRYFEFLPIANGRRVVDLGAGFTPLQRCDDLALELGVRRLYVKNDTVNPTLSFKDRPASVAVSKALEFGFEAVGCPSTGNLAAATAAHAAKARLPCYVLVPEGIEPSKVVQAAVYGARIVAVKGTYDDANRIAVQAAEAYNWGFVNINIRPYYVEGSKTLGFEVCEQLGWRAPDMIVVPVASGALLCAVWKGLKELRDARLVDHVSTKLVAAQPEGCSPVVDALKRGLDEISPVEKPETVAKSLAIGDPGDGYYAVKTVRETGGAAESASDREIVEAIGLLARREGIFAEPAGGTSIAVLKKLVGNGVVSPDEEVVCLVTGNGLKAPEAVNGILPKPITIEPRLSSLALIAA